MLSTLHKSCWHKNHPEMCFLCMSDLLCTKAVDTKTTQKVFVVDAQFTLTLQLHTQKITRIAHSKNYTNCTLKKLHELHIQKITRIAHSKNYTNCAPKKLHELRTQKITWIEHSKNYMNCTRVDFRPPSIFTFVRL